MDQVATRPGSHSTSDWRALAPDLLEVERHDIDGVPLFRLPYAGPTVLSISFGVGRAHEPVTDGGVTHLVEHLLMRSLHPISEYANGVTDAFRVSFVVRGTPEEVTEFAAGLCRAIEAPPLDGLDHEVRVVRTEAAGRGPMSLGHRMMWMRTGYQGIGTIDLPEFFLRSPDPERIRAWIRTHFVAGNAAMWLLGDIPPELAMRLPPGNMTPPPAVGTIDDLATPTMTMADTPAIAAGFAVERSVATVTAFRAAERRFRDRLRLEQGLAYEIGAEYVPTDPDRAFVSQWVTCLPAAVPDVQRGVLDTFVDLTRAGLTGEELVDLRLRVLRDSLDPGAFASRLDAQVRDVLLGDPTEPLSDLLDRQWALEPDDIAAAMRRAYPSMILLTPPNGIPGDRGLAAYPGATSASIGRTRIHMASGVRRLPFAKLTTARLAVGERGAALIGPDDTRLSAVLWDDLVAVVRETGDGRTLIGRDGYVLVVNAGEWRGGTEAVRAIDRMVPSHLIVPAES